MPLRFQITGPFVRAERDLPVLLVGLINAGSGTLLNRLTME